MSATVKIGVHMATMSAMVRAVADPELVWMKRESSVDPHRDARFDEYHSGADGEHIAGGVGQPVTGTAEHNHQGQKAERHQQCLHAHRVRMLIEYETMS